MTGQTFGYMSDVTQVMSFSDKFSIHFRINLPTLCQNHITDNLGALQNGSIRNWSTNIFRVGSHLGYLRIMSTLYMRNSLQHEWRSKKGIRIILKLVQSELILHFFFTRTYQCCVMRGIVIASIFNLVERGSSDWFEK